MRITMKTTKATTIMSQVLCASALLVPLALPVATHAQSLRATPPVVLAMHAQASTTPSDVVVAFLSAVQQGRNEADYSAYVSQALEQRIAKGALLSTLLGIQNDYLTFSVGNATIDAAGRAALTATLNYGASASQRPMTLVQEGGAWQIDTIVVPEAQPAPSTAPSATPAPAADPSHVVTAFLEAAKQGTAQEYAPYLAATLEQQALSGELPLLALLGLQSTYDVVSVTDARLDAAGRATVLADLGATRQRTFTLVQENGAWQIERIVLSETGAAALTPTETVVGFLTAAQHDPRMLNDNCFCRRLAS